MSNKVDLTGNRYGRLVVVKDSLRRKNSCVMWECLCDCGNTTYVITSHLKSGAIRSCGCLRKEENKVRLKTHGLSKSRLFRIWAGMISRCKNKTQSGYKNYGGRGISVCKEWNDSFSVFKDWAFAHGYNDNLTIERIDVNGNYCPENCKWITKAEQNNNTRQSHFVTIEGKTLTIKQWCDVYGISDKVVRCRIRRGWSEVNAITKPKFFRKSKL